jgi:hypothetical protein
MSQLSEDDAKLVILAKAARARINASSAAAVRDDMGRTFASASVDTPELQMVALDLVVGQAIASGSTGLEAAVVLGRTENVNLAAARALGGPQIPVYFCDVDGAVHTVLP